MTRIRSLGLLAVAATGLVLAACGGAQSVGSGATFYASSPLASPSFSGGLASPSPSASSSPQVAVGQASGLGTPASTVSLTDGLKFDPSATTVALGQVVQWTNTGAVAHNVTFDSSNDATSPTLNAKDTWEVKFSIPGTYQYHCTFHPGMNGTLTVTG